MAEVHLVAVDREDFLFRVPLLDLDRQDHLADLALEELLLRQPELIQIARNLLRQRAGALLAPPLDDVGDRRGDDAPEVQAEVLVEVGVLGGDDRVAQHRVDVVVADDDAPLRRELADDLPVGGVDAGDRARVVVVEGGNLREVRRVGEQYAAQDAEHRHDHEQRDDAGVASCFEDDVRHNGIADCRLLICRLIGELNQQSAISNQQFYRGRAWA